MSQPDRLQTKAPALATLAKPAPTAARVRPAPAAPARIAGDMRIKTAPAEPEPELLGPPKGATGWVRALWNMMFGNVENKLFQIKFNLIHFKDLLMGLMQALQASPLGPIFTLTDKVGALLAGSGAGVSAESSLAARAVAAIGRAASPVTTVVKVGFKWLERAAPVFGMLTAVQDLYKAALLQGDEKVSGDRKVFAWATFAFSTIGATASTIAAWTAVGSAVAVPLGLGSVGLGTIAIACFALSLLTGWLGSRLAKEQAATHAKAPVAVKA